MPEKNEKTLNFLKEASLYYRATCPEESRFLMQRHHVLSGQEAPEDPVCPFCFQWRLPDNHRVRLKGRRRVPPQLHRVVRKEAARRHLSLKQIRNLRRFHNASNTLMATCHACTQTRRQSGASRDFVVAATVPSRNQYTPGSTGRRKSDARTPQSTNKATPRGSTEKTPRRTPRSVSSESAGSTPSSSSKSFTAKKSPFARLRKFLSLDSGQKGKSGSLKDFLSSL